MGKIETDHTGSGGGITLSSDGTSLLLDGTAIGGGGGDPDLYADNWDGTATKPSATGVNTIAIGQSAVAGSSDDGIAIGRGANAGTSTQNMAIGAFSACGDAAFAVAFGREAKATGGNSMALGKGLASNTSSLSAQITNNTTTYGATGGYSIAIGQLSKATGVNSIAIGDTAISTTANQIALGGTTDTVKISGTYTLPTADGTANQVLTTDGAGAVTFATAGGGGASAYTIDTKSAAYTVVAGDLGKIIFMAASGTVTLPDPAVVGSGFWVIVKVDNSRTDGNTLSRTGTGNIVGLTSYYLNPGMSINLISDGTNFITDTAFSHMLSYDTFGSKDQASATGNRSIALGDGATASNNYSSAIGKNAQATGVNSLAIGSTLSSTSATGSKSSAIGANSSAAGSQSSGSGSMALGGSYASGTDSFAAAIANNTSTYGATGSNSVAMGKQTKASGLGSVALGHQAQATNSHAHASGWSSLASGVGSFAHGHVTSLAAATASGTGSVAFGAGSLADKQGKYAFASDSYWSNSTSGTAQYGLMALRRFTSDATPGPLVSSSNNTASTTNQIILPNNSAYAFHGTIVARQKASEGTASAAWKVEGLIRREGSAGTTVLVNSATTVLDNTPAWGMALTADTTNGGLAITVTGAAATNVRFVATIMTSEVTYA